MMTDNNGIAERIGPAAREFVVNHADFRWETQVYSMTFDRIIDEDPVNTQIAP